MAEPCKIDEGIKSIILIASTDMKFDKNGNYVMKRKYGKFNRPVHEYDLTKPAEEKPLTMTIKPGR